MDMLHNGGHWVRHTAPADAQKAKAKAEGTTLRQSAEECGVAIPRVLDIRPCEETIRIAHALNFIQGVLPVRGCGVGVAVTGSADRGPMSWAGA